MKVSMFAVRIMANAVKMVRIVFSVPTLYMVSGIKE